MSALSPGLGVLILGNWVFEGVGTGRAWAFGVISGLACERLPAIQRR